MLCCCVRVTRRLTLAAPHAHNNEELINTNQDEIACCVETQAKYWSAIVTAGKASCVPRQCRNTLYFMQQISPVGARVLDVCWASQDQLCLVPSECECLPWRLLSLLWRLDWGSDLCTPLLPSYFMEKSSSLAAVVVLPVG